MLDKVHVFFCCEESYSLFSGEFSKSRFGGAGLQMYLLAEELAKDSTLDVTFVFEKLDVSQLHHNSIKLVSTEAPIRRGLPYISRFINKARRLAPYTADGDKVVLMTMAPNAERLVDLGKEIGAKTILRIASDADNIAPVGCTPQRQEEIMAAISCVDAVVTQTPEQKNALLKANGKESFVIGNGLPTDGAYANRNSRDYILWVSSSQYLKRPGYFLDLARIFPNENFVMLMPPADKLLSAVIRRRAAKIDNLTLIENQITFDESRKIFSKAKLFINTSEVEGFPNTFLQAAGEGVPIVSMSVNPHNVLSEHGIGTCADDNLLEFFELVSEYLKDETEWEEASRAGTGYLKEHGNIGSVAFKYKETINALVR